MAFQPSTTIRPRALHPHHGSRFWPSFSHLFFKMSLNVFFSNSFCKRLAPRGKQNCSCIHSFFLPWPVLNTTTLVFFVFSWPPFTPPFPLRVTTKWGCSFSFLLRPSDWPPLTLQIPPTIQRASSPIEPSLQPPWFLISPGPPPCKEKISPPSPALFFPAFVTYLVDIIVVNELCFHPLNCSPSPDPSPQCI